MKGVQAVWGSAVGSQVWEQEGAELESSAGLTGHSYMGA